MMESQDAHQGLDIRTALGAIRRRAWLVVVCVLIAAGSALGLSLLQEKQYSASASLLFRDPAFDSQLFGSPTPPSQDPAREAATNVDLVSLQIVADRTAQKVGKGLTGEEVDSKVEIEPSEESNVVSVTATDPSPVFAAELANGYAERYLEFRQEADRSQVLDAQKLAEERYEALEPEEQAGEKGGALQNQISQLETLGALQTGNAELVQPARPPESPSSPVVARNTVLGGLAGLLIGLALALLAERLDRRLRDPNDLAEALSMPLIGTIPFSGALAGKASAGLPPVESEAFRMLRGRLRFFDVDRKITSVLVTSAEAWDGKSTVAWNLALTAASVGSRTILLECDFHKPSIAARRDLDPLPGLAEYLTGQSELPIQRVAVASSANGSEAERQLDVVIAGTTPPNSVELMESKRMATLLSELTADYDLVVLDAPPVTLVADVIPLITQVGGVAVVAEPGRTTREAADALGEALRRQHAPVLGVVANKVRGRPAQGYYHYAVGSLRVGEQSGRGD